MRLPRRQPRPAVATFSRGAFRTGRLAWRVGVRMPYKTVRVGMAVATSPATILSKLLAVMVTVLLVILLTDLTVKDAWTAGGRIIPGSAGCATAVPKGGVIGAAAKAGRAVASLDREPPSRREVRARLLGAARLSGEAWQTFVDVANGAPVPLEQTPPPTQQVSGCCEQAPLVLSAWLDGGDRSVSGAPAAARAAAAAGFTGSELVTAVAVAGAESGWDPNAANPTSTARGLWQIMLSLHRERLGGGAWNDPAANARAAFSVYEAQGWGAWVAHSNGAYRAFLDDARQAVGELRGVAGPAVELPANPAARVVPAADCEPSVPASSERGPEQVETAVRWALAQVGKDYQWGAVPWDGVGPAPATFDCSSLIDSAYLAAGIVLPGRATTRTLITEGQAVTGEVRRGDLVWTSVGHIGLAIGGGRMVVAPQTGEQVRVQAYGTPWAVRRLVEAGGVAA